jgi:hypothetical protein
MIPGVKFLLMGESGTGKTYSIRTWIEAGVTPFIVFMDLQGVTTMGDAKGMWHHAVITPGISDWSVLAGIAKTINETSFEGLAQKRGIDKKKHTQWYELMGLMANFRDTEGKEFGDVCSWGPDRVLVLDGLSGLSDMAMANILGAQPVRSPGDYGVAMNNIESLLATLAHGCRCHVMLIAHQEPEQDEVAMQRRIMVSTLGRKLAPVLPRYFDDVVQAVRLGTKFSWTTTTPNTTLKAKHVPYKDELLPSFGPVLEAWKKRGGTIQPQPVK